MVRIIISFFQLCSNAHSIKFTILTILKWYNLETFTILAILYNHHTLPSSRTFSSPQKRNPVLVSHSTSPNLWKPLLCFLSLPNYLFCIFHIIGIIKYIAFCVWLLSLYTVFSRFIHVVKYVSTSFLFMVE